MWIFSSQIYSPTEIIENGKIEIDDQGYIVSIEDQTGGESIADEDIIFEGKKLLPGMIDIHTHGGFGVAFGLGDLKTELDKYIKWAASTGVTGFLLSITAPDAASILTIIREYVTIFEDTESWSGAQPLGFHLEGPFLNPEKHGAFDPTWLRDPLSDELGRYLDAGGNWIKQVSLAPELPGAMEFAQMLADRGITPALGHSNTTFDIARKALEGPFEHVTHTFNAQSGLHHREPGVVGAVLASNRITAELVADGIHVHPAVMNILFRCLGAGRVALITDAMPGAGLPDGDYQLMERKITVKNGKATLPDGTIASSTATMLDCLRTTEQLAGIPFKEALQAATLTPAKAVGISNLHGSIELGKQADLAIMNGNYDLEMTIVKGRIAYQKGKY